MSYTPRHMRRKNNASRNGTVGPDKTRAFRKAKKLSDKFIHQSADALEKSPLNNEYREYKRKCDNGTLRAG